MNGQSLPRWPRVFLCASIRFAGSLYNCRPSRGKLRRTVAVRYLARSRAMSTALIQVDVFGRSLRRDVTIQNLRGMGQLLLPKGTRVSITKDVGETDGSWILVDAYLRPDTIFYGTHCAPH